MMMKIGMEVAQDYTVFKYIPPIPHKDLDTQDITIVSGQGMNLAPKYFLPGHSKEKVENETPPDALIMDNLETLLKTTVDKVCGNTNGAVVDRFIKSIEPTMFVHPVYFLDGPGRSIDVPDPHEKIFNSNHIFPMLPSA